MLFFLAAAVATVQALASLVLAFRDTKEFDEGDLAAGVLIMVPVCDESEHVLRRTFDSCLHSTYPDDGKVLFVTVDGEVTGQGEPRTTTEIVANILGFETQCGMEDSYPYPSLGSHGENTANIYTGTYNANLDDGTTRSMNYVVLIKRGVVNEAAPLGSRGQRDSELILTGMLNRIHHNREPNPLDMALVKVLFDFGLPVKDIDYLMIVDPGTRLGVHAMTNLVYNMEDDMQVLACGGETLVDNKTTSWATMIQIFDYFSSHFVKRSFESVCGCVSTLSPGVAMYRVYSEDLDCLIGNDRVYQEYSRDDIQSFHEEALFDNGKSRLLSTLLLQVFPSMKLLFVPDAKFAVEVPDSLTSLLDQRRRQFSFDFHNTLELFKIPSGCCLSMTKAVAFLDLITSMILPTLVAYIVYLLFLFVTDAQDIDRPVLIILGYAIGMQMLTSLMVFRWDHLIWFPFFLFIGIPFFYLLLPIYAFLKMDDCSPPSPGRPTTLQKIRSRRASLNNGPQAALEASSTAESIEVEGDNVLVEQASLQQTSRPSRTVPLGTLSETEDSSSSDSPSTHSREEEMPTHSGEEETPKDEEVATNSNPPQIPSCSATSTLKIGEKVAV